VLVIALVIISVVAFTRPTDNAAALRKAAQLEQVLKRAGLPMAPNVGDLAASLGTNGGLVCETSGLDLPGALLNQQLSAGGVLTVRPIPLDKDILNSQLAIIDVYCPSRVAAFMKYFKEYKVYKLIRS
jgi:hypothetical protein